jgi:hypothetical protein
VCIEAGIHDTYYAVTEFFSEENLFKEMIRIPAT